MARISLINPEEANSEVKEIYEKTLRGKPGNVQTASCTNSSTFASPLSTDAATARNTTWHRRSASGSGPKIGRRLRREIFRAMEKKSVPRSLMSKS